MRDIVTAVINEVRLLNNRLIELVDDLHHDTGISAPQRAVLEFIHRDGPATVPTIARTRGVTRQHIQTISNELRALNLIEPLKNPAHQRSPLMTLTESGRETIERMLLREGEHLAGSVSDLDENRLLSAVQTLADLRHALSKEPH